MIKGTEQKLAKRLVFHSESFDYEIRNLRDVSKERHDLFIEHVTTTKESLNIKIAKLKSLLSKEVNKMEENYTLLNGKIDVIVGAITKLVEFNTKYTKYFEAKLENDKKVIVKMEEFLSCINESLSKVDLLI